MTDKTPTHIPAEGEGTPLLPAEPAEPAAASDAAAAEPQPGDDDFVPAGTHPA